MSKRSSSPFWESCEDPMYVEVVLPNCVDVAIVGGGLSGSSMVYWLSQLQRDAPLQIALFEQGRLAAGATGRNGGHLRPLSDAEEDCAKEMICLLSQHKLEEEVHLHLYSDLPSERLAGQIHPTKLVHALVTLSKDKLGSSLHILTQTKVLSIKSSSNCHLLSTSRGTLQCQTLLICTNGHTAQIIPELKGLIVPTRGQCIATESIPADIPVLFPRNASFEAEDKSSLYIIQRKADRRIVAGGFRTSELAGAKIPIDRGA